MLSAPVFCRMLPICVRTVEIATPTFTATLPGGVPAKDGTIPPQNTVRLPDANAGESVLVTRVTAQNAEQLTYLGSLGIRPDASITVVHKAPFDGPVHLRVGTTSHHVGLNLARQIFIRRKTKR